MASGPTLPPQAYTREILTSAFNWLQTQPDSVRKLATTPDALVGLFMRAQRFGSSSAEADAPVSSQNFMSDLKNLAEGLKQFDEPAPYEPLRREAPRAPTTAPIMADTQRREPPRETRRPMSQNFSASGSTGNFANHQPSGTWSRETFEEAPRFEPPPVSTGLNERSLAMIQEVKATMNLSSDAEAVNMMVALAYKTLKNLIV